MRNREYWQKRFSAVEEMRNKRGRLTVDQIAPHFDRAQAAIDKEIRVWYQRFADNNGISLAEAKKLLRQNELDELKWDIEEYIKRGQENAVSQKWLKELENASAKFHISRLEALKLRTQNAAENAFAAEQNRLTERLMDTWKEDYYHTAFEVQKGFSLGFDVARVDENRVNKLLDTPWTADGQTFSDRIWKSKAQLLDSVSSELTQMCILGKAPDDAIAAIAKRMNVAKSQAGRLVMTENAYFGSAAQQQCYEDLDVERYQIVATLDSRTSDICRHLDGKVFEMADYEPGVTAPPFHVYCRSCTVPYFEDNDDNGMRAQGTRTERRIMCRQAPPTKNGRMRLPAAVIRTSSAVWRFVDRKSMIFRYASRMSRCRKRSCPRLIRLCISSPRSSRLWRAISAVFGSAIRAIRLQPPQSTASWRSI